MVINPLRERALERFAAPQDPVEMATFGDTRIASEYCQVRVGGDVAVLKGMMKLMLEAHDEALRRGAEPVLDFDFHRGAHTWFRCVRRRSAAHDLGRYPARVAACRAISWSASPISTCERGLSSSATAWDITQHRRGTANVQQIANLLLLRGNFGKPGAGICPVRGHSNVQGDRTVGIDEKPKPAFLDQIQAVFGFDPPRAHGHDVVEAIRAMVDGRAKVFIGLGGNFVAAVPDKDVVEAAMRRMRLTVGISTKLNRGHLVHGEQALILPCLARSDIDIQNGGRQSVTVEDSMSMVHASSGLVAPPSEHLRSEVAIVCGMAKATLADQTASIGTITSVTTAGSATKSNPSFHSCSPILASGSAGRAGFIWAVRRVSLSGIPPQAAPTLLFSQSSTKTPPAPTRPRFASRRCGATTNTTRRSIVSTTAIVACSAAAWWCS